MTRPRVLRNPMRASGPVPGTPGEPPDPAGERLGAPIDFHRRLPGYTPSPLRELPDLAAELGVRRVLVKDESERLGLHAFKMLGASWAVYRALVERLGGSIGSWDNVDELAALLAPLRPLSFVAATDGNHGQALARTARLLGFAARIWVPAHTSVRRIEAIAGEGARVVVSSGGYDQAVQEAAGAAAHDPDGSTIVISDTSWEGYEIVPRWVIDGYRTIFDEIDDQLAAAALDGPDVVVVPIGVGALAAAVAANYRAIDAVPTDGQPLLIGVEPVDAACVAESMMAGHIVSLEGEQTSIMAGLNCGTPSPVAWPRVSTAFDWMVTVTDSDAEQAVRDLAAHGLVSGESGAATLAGWRRASDALAAAGADVRGLTVLLLSTEGATDPESYACIVRSVAD